MKAIVFDRFGDAPDVLKLADIPMPQVGAGEVLVKLFASAPNPSDTNKRKGSFPALVDEGFVVPHSDGAGLIEAVGEGVNTSRIGQRVWVFNAQFRRRFGTCAQYVTIDSRYAVLLPETVSFSQGACLGIPAMTAHRCVFSDGEVKGKTIVVSGGAGRVGYFAIQLASLAGANVIATITDERDRPACIEAGANAVINIRDAEPADRIIAANLGNKVDRIVEVQFGANLTLDMEIIAENGVIATYNSTTIREPSLPFFEMLYKGVTVQFVIVYALPVAAREQAIADITKHLQEHSLNIRIAAELPMTDAAAAHELIEQGSVRGAVIVDVTQ